MTSIPYPTFIYQLPIDVENGRAALPSVGKCRIHPATCTANTSEFRAIVAKNAEQAAVSTTFQNKSEEDAAKALKKKFMKQGVAMATAYLTETLKLDVSVVNVEIFLSSEDLVNTDGCIAACFLDAGCAAIVADGLNLEALDIAKIPKNRMVAHFQHPFASSSYATSDSDVCTKGMKDGITLAAELASIVSVELSKSDNPDAESIVEILRFEAQKQEELGFQLIVQFNPADCNYDSDEDLAAMVAAISKACKDGHGNISIVDPTANQLGLSFAACMKTDRQDGLFTTVVCTRSGEALGLVYSSKESIVAALECGRGVYFSRSRKGLWRKGDTSGHFQTLHRLDVDCDGDALRFTVTQRGNDCAAFCHLNTLTCWGETCGLRQLEGVMQERLKSAPEGSYTKRLFEDPELLRDKLVEEAQELAEAVEKDDVAAEFADVLYFAMARAAKAGVSIDDAVAELDRRARKVTRRQGDSKTFRIEAGQAILDKPK